MAMTRKAAQPLQIYQDEDSPETQNSIQQPNDAIYRTLGPLSDASLNSNMKFKPSYTSPRGLSPQKQFSQSSSPPPEALANANFTSIVIPPPEQCKFVTDSLEKKQQSNPLTTTLVPDLVQTPFTIFQSSGLQSNKENVYSSVIHNENTITHKNAIYGQKAPLKRTLMEAAPLELLKDRANNKKPKLVEQITTPAQLDDPIVLPPPTSFPPLEDDGTKPPYSYAQLIGMAILRSPNRRLTLSKIYAWITSTFSFYHASGSGWQNSIRHNLSLSKDFEKQERPKDDPGKGHYWIIKPGCEGRFLEIKPRRSTNSDPPPFINSSTESIRPSTAPSSLPFPPPPLSKNIDSSKFPDEIELSSDATIPASDPAVHEGLDAEIAKAMHAREVCSSPPPIHLGSSPPPIVNQPTSRAPERDGTPPPVPRFPRTSRSGGHKRKFAAISGLGDSGYYSSIDSSVQREHRPHFLTSDVDFDHPTRKRGRAEEEIARIRSSSYDSPSKARSTLRPSTAIGISSSPFQPFEPPKAPLTPPEIFKKPARPIASVSPNTNLKNHRNKVKQMLASPNVQPLSLDMPNLDVDVNEYNVYEPSGTNHFFYDHFLDTTLRSAADRGSPEKRPSKRPRLERTNTTASILADVTGARSNINVSPIKTPKLDQTLLRSPERFWPSLIKSTQKQSTSHMANENTVPDLQFPQEENDFLFGVDLPSDASEPGFDITQGFQKIGAPTPIPNSSLLASPANVICNPSPAKRSNDKASSRSSLGRSMTTLF